jgi:hypothetical protein
MSYKPVAYLLAFTLSLAPPGFGQARGYLSVKIVDGDNAFNDIKRKEARAPVVEIRDDENRVVPGAQVTFTLPAIGASGTFASGKNTSTVTADAQGIARAGEFTPSNFEGRFNIKVTATHEGKEGSIVIAQTNTLAGSASSSHKKLFIMLAIVAAGAGVGIALGLRGSKTSTPPPVPTVLTSGGITVGGP